MATIKIYLDKRRITKDNTYPLNFRFYYASKSTSRSTSIYLTAEQWDDVKKQIRKHPDALRLNKQLQKKLADLQSKLLLATDDEVESYLNPKPIVKEIVKPKPTVFAFTYEVIKDLRLDNKIGNAWAYENALTLY